MKKIYQSFWQISWVFGLTLVTSNAQALECTPTPDCGSLGYTKTEADCQEADVVLKCPTDTSKMSCWTLWASQKIVAGAILYGDGTVYDKVVAGKTPIGVVFDATHRLALALTDVKQDGSAGSEEMQWSSNTCDIPNLENCEDVKTCGGDGRRNTDAILATNGGCSGTTYAANAVNSYEPEGCSADFCRKGKWFLPCMSDFYFMKLHYSEVENTLGKLLSYGGDRLYSSSYWLSNEASIYSAWRGYPSIRSSDDFAKGSTELVRPVIAF